MSGVVASGEQAAVYERVQGFHATIHHFGEACDFGDIEDGEFGVAKRAGGAAGADDLDVVSDECLCELDEIGFVGDAEERAAYREKFGICHDGFAFISN